MELSYHFAFSGFSFSGELVFNQLFIQPQCVCAF